MIIETFEESPQTTDQESLRVNHNSRRISGRFNVHWFTDKDTNQVVYYVPAFDISGYGETDEKAKELTKENIKNLFEYWLTLTPKNLKKELQEMGWHQVHKANKEYSKTYVDIAGQLQNFNAVDDQVHRLSLTAA